MEDDLSNFHHEDDALDRELNSLVREIEHEEAVRRAVIEMLVMPPSTCCPWLQRRLQAARHDGRHA